MGTEMSLFAAAAWLCVIPWVRKEYSHLSQPQLIFPHYHPYESAWLSPPITQVSVQSVLSQLLHYLENLCVLIRRESIKMTKVSYRTGWAAWLFTFPAETVDLTYVPLLLICVHVWLNMCSCYFNLSWHNIVLFFFSQVMTWWPSFWSDALQKSATFWKRFWFWHLLTKHWFQLE